MVCYNEFIEDEFSDINLLRDFRYVTSDSICAVALDMLPDDNEIYIISSYVGAIHELPEKTYRFYDSKNIEQSKIAYR